MGRRLQIGIILGVVLALLAAVGAYAWDSAKKDEIADGVRVGGISMAGRTSEEAQVRLRSNLVEPLKKPVHVSFEGERYTLTPQELKMRADIDGMVDAALAASQEGGLPGRLWRYATGGEVDRNIAPRISYSEDVLGDFVEGVVGKIDRDPRDASIDPTPTSLSKVPARDGVQVKVDPLRSKLESAIQSPRSSTVQAPTQTLKPEVTLGELKEQYPYYITIDRSNFQLRFFKDLKLAKTYTIAVGQVGYDTPAGEYHIQNKAVNPAWSVPNSGWAGDLAGTVVPGGTPQNPLKARWMGIYDGAGIHGTDDVGSLGTAASHGCIRMSIPDVIELYDQIPVQTPVYIF